MSIWNEEKIKFLVDNYELFTIKMLSKELGISKPTIIKKRKDIGLERTSNLVIKNEIDKINRLLLQELPYNELKRLSNVRDNLLQSQNRKRDRLFVSNWDGKCIGCSSIEISLPNIRKKYYKCKNCSRLDQRTAYVKNRESYLNKISSSKNAIKLRLATYKSRDRKRGSSVCDFSVDDLINFFKQKCLYCHSDKENRKKVGITP